MNAAWGLLLIPVVYLAAIVDTSLADRLQVGPVTPDLLALIAILWVLVARSPWSFLAAGAIGLFADLVSPGRIGLGTACFLLVAYGVGRLRGRAATENLAGQVAVVLVAVALIGVGMTTGRWLLGEAAEPLPALLLRALGAGLYTAAVSLPVLMVIGWVREPLLRRRRKLVEF